MVRHVCGTCRFFRANDPNRKSGWCGHPQRQTTTDVHILVRAGELNCRNDWDKDLWQLREDGDRVLDISMARSTDQRDQPRTPQRPEAPRTLGHDSPLIDRPTSPAAPADDILIGEDLDAPRLVSEDINREMLRRAREQYRARRLTSRPEGPSPRLGDGPPPTIHRSEPIVISNDVQPLQIGQEPGPDLTRVDRRDHTPRLDAETPAEQAGGAFSSVPAVEDAVEVPRRPTRRLDVIPTVDDFEMESIRNYDEVVEPRTPDSLSRRRAERQGRRTERTVEETRAVDRRERREDELAFEPDDELDEPSRATTVETHPDDRATARAAVTSADPVRAVDPDDIRPWDYVEPRRPRPGDIDGREVGRTAPPSPTTLWDDIPRCCRTCRDFRPAEAGGRGGWCTNKWAFRHRRMVDIDQLTCETTIGDWWLPTDDAWQDDFDVGRHALATPLMDRWFGRLEEEVDPDYPVVASRTRRRS